jgi:hypothetical protein
MGEDDAGTGRAKLLPVAAGLAAAALGLGVVAGTRASLIVASESDGHYLAAGWIACGDTALLRQVTRAAWPPGFPWLVARLLPLTHDTLLAARLVSVGSLALLVAAVAEVARRAWRTPRSIALAAALAALTPQLLTYGTLGTTDVAAAALLAAALPAALAASAGSGAAAVVAGLLAGLATQVRYQAFPPALALIVALGPASAGPLRARVRAVALAAAGLLVALALGTLLPGAAPGDLGGLRPALTAVPTARDAPTDPSALPGRYGYSALLALWLLDGLPALGLAQLAVGGLGPDTRARDRRLLLAPAVVAFLAVGWFPHPGGAELRRLFLPLLAPAVLGTVALVRRLAASPARRALPALAAAHALVTANQLFGEIPAHGLFRGGVPGPRLGFEVPARAWDLDPEPGHVEAVAATLGAVEGARGWLAAHPPGCRLAVTDDVAASRLWPSAWLEHGLTTASLDARLAALREVTDPAWVVVDAARSDVGPGALVRHGAATLVEEPGPPGLRVLRIVPITVPRERPPTDRGWREAARGG